MTYSVYPEQSALWKMRTVLPDEQIIDIGDDTTPLTDTGDAIIANVSAMPTGQTVEIYALIEDGMSLADEKEVMYNLRCTKLPSFFGTCELFMQDGDGNEVVYAITKAELGKDIRSTIEAHPDSDEFNSTYVMKIGFRFLNPKTADATMKVTISGLIISNDRMPTYAKPQEVVSFMGLLDNDANPLVLTHTSYPSLETVANLIVQAESYIDGATHNSWRENRVVGQMYDAPSGMGVASPLMMQQFIGSGVFWNTFVKGFTVPLYHQHIRPIDYSKGDQVETRMWGTSWRIVPCDPKSTPDNTNVWGDWEKGLLFIKQIFVEKLDSVRVTYRWGEDNVPSDINLAAIIVCSKQILASDWYRPKMPIYPSANDELSKSNLLKTWDSQLKDCLRNHITNIVVGGV